MNRIEIGLYLSECNVIIICVVTTENCALVRNNNQKEEVINGNDSKDRYSATNEWN